MVMSAKKIQLALSLESLEMAKFIEDLGWYSNSYVSLRAESMKQLDLEVVVTHEMSDNSGWSRIAYGLKRI